jgi:hypothetical protein
MCISSASGGNQSPGANVCSIGNGAKDMGHDAGSTTSKCRDPPINRLFDSSLALVDKRGVSSFLYGLLLVEVFRVVDPEPASSGHSLEDLPAAGQVDIGI